MTQLVTFPKTKLAVIVNPRYVPLSTYHLLSYSRKKILQIPLQKSAYPPLPLPLEKKKRVKPSSM